jgi:predicted PurR-regulated permease PerM
MVRPWIVFIKSVFDSFLDMDSIDISSISNQAVNVLSKMSSSGISMIFLSFSSILAWLLTLSNFAFNVFLYFTIVNFLIKEENDLVETCLKKAPKNIKQHLQFSLTQSIQGIFLSSFQLVFHQALYTWILFDFAGLSYAYLYTLVAAFLKIVPLLSTPLIGVCGGFQMFFGHGRHPLLSIGFGLLYGWIDAKIQ